MLYFDNNATTPVAPEAAEALTMAAREIFGNPSSSHREGQRARQQIEDARRKIASFLHADAAEIVFTSGGTESDNLAIFGLIRTLPGTRKHAITTEIEHPAVLEPFRRLERDGLEVTYLKPDESGTVTADTVARNLRPETVMISVMHANNETGVIQPIEDIAAIVRRARDGGQPIYFHSDGVQAAGKLDANLNDLGIDLYSISAHKIYAPKGMGALAVRKGTPLQGRQLGGRHERDRRGGTENVPGACAFARAAELCSEADRAHFAALRDRFEAQVLSALADVEVNGAGAKRVPNTSNLLFRGISAEALMIALDVQGMAVSTGAACSSGAIEPSHVLIAMGRTPDEAKSSVRFSFGRYNSEEEADRLSDAVIACVRRLRERVREQQLV